MKAPTQVGNEERNTVKIYSAHQFIFKTLTHLFIPNLVITPTYYTRDEGLTPTEDGGTCLRRLNMFRKEVH